MIPARPKIPAAIPPTTAPVEIVAPDEAFPLVPVEEGLDVREVGLGCVNEVVRSDDV
jgi:hypothetical protein